MAIEIRPRSAWGARRHLGRTRLASTADGWFVHHNGPPMSGSTRQRLRGIQNYHMDTRDWTDFAYNFAVDDDGTIWEGRGWGWRSAATDPYNGSSHAILVPIGLGQEPTDACAASIRALIAEGARLGYRPDPIRPHNAVANKPCPGPTLTRWIAEGRLSPGGTPMPDPHVLEIQQVLTNAGFDPGPLDGIPGPQTARAAHEMKNAFEDRGNVITSMADQIADLEAGNVPPDDVPETVLGRELVGLWPSLDALAKRARALAEGA